MAASLPLTLTWLTAAIDIVTVMQRHNQEHPEALEFFVPISYEPLPPLAKLEKEFPGRQDNVHLAFSGAVFSHDPACKDINESSGIRVMRIWHPDQTISTDTVINEIIKGGKVSSQRDHPGTERELLAFAKAHPQLQRAMSIAALGSETSINGRRCFAFLSWDHCGRGLGLRSTMGNWGSSYGFLVVCESAYDDK